MYSSLQLINNVFAKNKDEVIILNHKLNECEDFLNGNNHLMWTVIDLYR